VNNAGAIAAEASGGTDEGEDEDGCFSPRRTFGRMKPEQSLEIKIPRLDVWGRAAGATVQPWEIMF
jgi:hypothetical protein